MRRSILLVILLSLAGCAGGRHHEVKKDADRNRNETEQERAVRVRHETEIKTRQAADAERFHKALDIIRTVQPGDAYSDFYRKASAARISLERVSPIEDGRVERYAFADNSTAFVIVVVKADHIREIQIEGAE